MREAVFETLIGFAVIVAAAVFFVFAMVNGQEGTTGTGTYDVTARFNNVTGVNRGSDVRLAGVKVGVVKSIEADFERAEAVLRLSVDSALELPDDTDARILTEGLLGGSFIALEPGGGYDYIPTDGTGEILFTRGSVDLLTLVGSFASSLGSDAEQEAP
jgi:phospholipid/cholesterol/gamma-HCH transport system substrate-binding protein